MSESVSKIAELREHHKAYEFKSNVELIIALSLMGLLLLSVYAAAFGLIAHPFSVAQNALNLALSISAMSIISSGIASESTLRTIEESIKTATA